MDIKRVSSIAGISASVAYIVLIMWTAVAVPGSDVLGDVTIYQIGCTVVIFGALMAYFGGAISKSLAKYVLGITVVLGVVILALSGILENSWAVYSIGVPAICLALAYSVDGSPSGRKGLAMISFLFAAAIAVLFAIPGTGMLIASVSAVFVIFLELSSRFSVRCSVKVPEIEVSKMDKVQGPPVEKSRPEPVKIMVENHEPKDVPVRVADPAHVVPKAESKPFARSDPVVENFPPKLKVMSSREAAAARESASRVKDTEILFDMANTDATEEAVIEDAEVMDVIFEETPEILLRRAAWNKGLRCRRDYGEHKIPIAFVKGKVAVFVDDGCVNAPEDEILMSEGWTVLRYSGAEIVDGKEQSEEICKVVRNNIRERSKAKGKRSKK